MAWIGPTEACRKLSITRGMLQKKLPLLVELGCARRDGSRWKLQSDGLADAYEAVTRFRSDTPRVAAAQVKPQRAAVEPEGEEGAEIGDLTTSRLKAEHYKAELARLAFEEQSGTLISAERVKKDQFEAGKRVRDSMLQIPVRLEHRIGREFAQLLEAEIRDQLTRVALELQEGETE